MRLIMTEQGAAYEVILYEGNNITSAMDLIRHIIILQYRDKKKNDCSIYFEIKDELGFKIFESHYNKGGII